MIVSPQEMEAYRRTARRRAEQDAKRLSQRFAHAHETAQRAAKFLIAEFDVSIVMVFGSLVHRELFHSCSDIDLAVWGLDEFEYYRAVGQLQAVDPEFPIDLVRIEEASESLQKRIKDEGVPL